MSRAASTIRKTSWTRLLVIAPLILVGLFFSSRVYSAELLDRSLMLDNNLPSASARYQLQFTVQASEMLGSIKLQFCANDPLFSDPCTTPAGMDVTGAVIASQSGATGFAVAPTNTNANTLVISRAPASIASPVTLTYEFTNIINPSSGGTYYGRLQTFPGSDTSAPENDHGGLAFSIGNPVQISTTVPPYLLFCGGITITGFDCGTASGNYVNFGNLTSGATSAAQTQLLAATNGQGGYQIQMYGSTMTSGNNVISPMAALDVSKPGTSQFGINLAANQTPQVGTDVQGPGSATVASGYATPNWFQFSSGSAIAGVTTSDSYRQYTVSYIVNIPTGQTPGVYVATLTYVCLANF